MLVNANANANANVNVNVNVNVNGDFVAVRIERVLRTSSFVRVADNVRDHVDDNVDEHIRARDSVGVLQPPARVRFARRLRARSANAARRRERGSDATALESGAEMRPRSSAFATSIAARRPVSAAPSM